MLERIHRLGPLPFDDYLDIALYDPDFGFYAGGGGAGRSGDFITSPELGTLFGEIMAEALTAWWTELGQPDPFVVVEAGAGSGALAAAVIGSGAAVLPALHYVLVEESVALRARQAENLPLEPPAWSLGPALGSSAAMAEVGYDDDDATAPTPGTGPVVTALAELPALPSDALAVVVLANELLDNLPFALLERGTTGWSEVRVGEIGGELIEIVLPAAEDLAAAGDRFAPAAEPGARIPAQRRAQEWLRHALVLAKRGRVVIIDYCSTTAAMAARPQAEWLRTYRAHGRGVHSLAAPGYQDVTCEVAADQLAAVRAPLSDRSQAEFLRAFGLDERVASARAIWDERAASPDLDALRARSVVTEAAALTDSTGMGTFRAIEWVKNP